MMETTATIFLLLALAAVMQTFIAANWIVAESANSTTAGFLAQKQMACLLGNPNLTSDLGTIPWLDETETLPIRLNGAEFTVETVLTDCGGDPDVKQASVTVRWNEFRGSREFTLVGLVSADE